MFNDLLTKIVMGTIRHLLAGLGSALVADGILMQSQFNDYLGSTLFLAGIIWSAIDKKISHQKETANVPIA